MLMSSTNCPLRLQILKDIIGKIKSDKTIMSFGDLLIDNKLIRNLGANRPLSRVIRVVGLTIPVPVPSARRIDGRDEEEKDVKYG